MPKTDSIVLGDGCFWCLEASYQLVDGVVSVVPGYSGVEARTAVWEQVCSGRTGHVEVVRVTFETGKLSLETVLAIFWTIHDPTSLNRQGADTGTEYASVIFYETDEQRAVIEKSRAEAQEQLGEPIVTRVEPLSKFYEAEAYHHNFFARNPEVGYCRVVIEPKLAKLRQHFSDKLA